MSASLTYPAGAVTPFLELLHPKSDLWIIELKNGQDNRLTGDFINEGIKPALDEAERQWRAQWGKSQELKNRDLGKGALIIVGRRDQDKFFSNGLDYENAIRDPNFFAVTFNPMLMKILTFPIPTIAAINGHCFAAGLMLSFACDYRIMTDGSKRNAWLCMNEVHFGAPWPSSFAALVRAKFGDHRLHRKIALEGHRFTASQALADGILDQTVNGNTADILAAAEKVAGGISSHAATGVWGLIKYDLYRTILEQVVQETRATNPLTHDIAAKSRL